MGVYYTLINATKRERIAFSNLPFVKEREIAGNPAGAAIVAWYLLKNPGDRIAFYGDELPPPFPDLPYSQACGFPDRTDAILSELVEAGILEDCGILWQDEEDPTLFTRDFRNCCMPESLLIPKSKQDDRHD